MRFDLRHWINLAQIVAGRTESRHNSTPGYGGPSSSTRSGHAFWIFFKLLTGGKPAFDHSHDGINVIECSRVRIPFQMGNIEHQDPFMR
jgi:hypothetical protein